MAEPPRDRHRRILNYLEQNKVARVKELSEVLGVSEMTIRRDLRALDEQHLVVKTHGGAVHVDRPLSREVPFHEKLLEHTAEKRRIGVAAAELVHDGDTILLDAGTTTLELARALSGFTRLTVITNDLQIALQLAHKPGIRLIMTGGILHEDVYTLLGPSTEAFLSAIHVDRSFLGADGVDPKAGVTNRTLPEVPVKEAMIRAAHETVLLCDASKFGRKVFAKVCDLRALTAIITDSRLDPTAQALYREAVPRLIVV